MQLGVINAEKDCNLLLITHIPSVSLSDFCHHTSVFQDKTKESWNEAMARQPAFPCQGSKTNEELVVRLKTASTQPAAALSAPPCQHHPAMPGNCWECHCAAANLLPVLLPRPLKDFGSSCPSCPGSWACIGCVVFHLLLLLSPPLTGKSGEPLSFSILRLLDPENLYSRQKDDRMIVLES